MTTDIPPRETLFHFSARLGLQQVTEFLMYQPGSLDALSLQNNEGLLPIDIAQERTDDKLINTLMGYVFSLAFISIKTFFPK